MLANIKFESIVNLSKLRAEEKITLDKNKEFPYTPYHNINPTGTNIALARYDSNEKHNSK